MKIGICGFGFVGGAVYDSIIDKNNVVIYDPFKKKTNKDDLLDCDFVFVCVPTPFQDGEFNGNYVNETFQYLSQKEYNGIVVLKSTCHPSYIDYKELKLVSNPEFLKEVQALEDFRNQDTVFLGGDLEYCHKVKDLFENHFDLNVKKYTMTTFEEALIFKYIRNIKIAYDVMFWEFVEETTNNYKKYNIMMEQIPVNIKNIRLDGKPGFGGHCLPKDVNSYPSHKLTKFLTSYNNKIRNK